MVDEAKGPRVETTVREYGKDGELVKTTTTVVTVATPAADSKPVPGGYL